VPLGTMTNDSIREHCLSLEHATEVVQWGDHLLFKVGGKMFAMIDLDGHRCSMRCSPERYAELVEMEDIVPSGHNMWKYHWVTLEALDALPIASCGTRSPPRTSSCVRNCLPGSGPRSMGAPHPAAPGRSVGDGLATRSGAGRAVEATGAGPATQPRRRCRLPLHGTSACPCPSRPLNRLSRSGLRLPPPSFAIRPSACTKGGG